MPPAHRGAFFDAVVTAMAQALPSDLQAFATRRFSNNLQVIVGPNPRIHYEIWLDTQRNHLEIGFHCESDPVSTIRLLGCLDREIVAIKHVLGPQVELGRWTQSWGRLVEFHPLEPIESERGERIGQRLAEFVEVIQPVVDVCTKSHE